MLQQISRRSNFNTMNRNEIGQYIRRQLDIRNMTQADLATATGLSKDVINRMVNGREGPGESAFKAVAEALEIVIPNPVPYFGPGDNVSRE